MKSSGWIMYAVVASFVFILIITTGAFAEDEANLAKQAQNPIANLISLPLQNNTNFGIGPEDETQNILNIQPVLPFGITESLNLITRTILPVVSQPDILTGGEGRINGLGEHNLHRFCFTKRIRQPNMGRGPGISSANRHG